MLFYFTGTGNSLHAAQMIAKHENDCIISIHDAVRNGVYHYDLEENEAIGFVFPSYYYGLPSTVLEFIESLELKVTDKNYVYSVVTCGVKTGGTNKMMEGCLAKRGISLSAAFAFKTVDNYISEFRLQSDDGIREILTLAAEDLDVIIEQISRRERGDFDKVKDMFPNMVTKLQYPIYNKIRLTKNFVVNDSCIGCGQCSRVCNSNAIEMRDKRPVWVVESCNLCFACLHRCKFEAIEFGKKTARHGRYVNPNVNWKWLNGKCP